MICTRVLQELTLAGIAIAAIDHAGDENPVDFAWGADRPAPPHEAVRLHPMEYAGETVQEKLAKVSVPWGILNARVVALCCDTRKVTSKYFPTPNFAVLL